ncbi:hypothetical protein ACIBQ1_51550 [Nonomuraea sp. NPDC050153]|uniref:hypothetical protein n=1 Tax=Nonomuraea sp. NPDC050153 TaxID=3364359 RepID=UPI00379C101B
MDELIERWTVLSDEVGLVGAKQEGTRLAFALLLKYFTQHGRFPRGRAEFPGRLRREADQDVGRQLGPVPVTPRSLLEVRS